MTQADMKKFDRPRMNLGDKMWVMKDNKPIEVSIVIITVDYMLGMNKNPSTSIKYTLSNDVGFRYECTSTNPGDFIYLTKQSLLDSL